MKKLLLLFFILLPCLSYADVNYTNIVNEISQKGDELIKHYDAKNSVETMDGFSQLYFDHYEASGMELAVAAISPAVNVKTESLFTQLIGLTGHDASRGELEKVWTALKMRLLADVNLLASNGANTFFEAFLQAFSILLREGFEALLIVTALLAYLRKTKQEDKSRVIYAGVALATIASVFTAILLATIFKHLGANREAIEGSVMLVAALVMFYVSFWLLSKRESMQWQRFIKQKMTVALSKSNVFALGLTAFLAVYREGAESILFYQALIINSKNQSLGILTGFICACFALYALYVCIQKASIKIPYKLFFTVTAIFLYYMAFSFIGTAILEFQEAGMIDITPIAHFPQIVFLGILPAWENVSAQLAFLMLTILILAIWQIKHYFQREQIV